MINLNDEGTTMVDSCQDKKEAFSILERYTNAYKALEQTNLELRKELNYYKPRVAELETKLHADVCEFIERQDQQKSEKIAALTAECERLKGELAESKKCEAVCHCGEMLSRHGYSENHGAVAMEETCPYSIDMVEAKREAAQLRAESTAKDALVKAAYFEGALLQREDADFNYEWAYSAARKALAQLATAEVQL